MPARNILIILGHPDADSFCGAMADTYQQAAKAAGHKVQLFRLGEIDFDPVLRHGYRHAIHMAGVANVRNPRLLKALGRRADDFATDERLKEINFGRWEGMTWKELKVSDP